MDIKLKMEPIIHWEEVFASRTDQTDTAEMVVPDSLPDIHRILDVEAEIYRQNRVVSAGRAEISGEIHGMVLYLGEGTDRIQKLEIRFPCTITAEDPSILEADRLAARTTVASAETRVLNPRKISWQVGTVTDLRLYRKTVGEIPIGTEDEDLQTLLQKETLGYVAAVEEKSFVVSEELALPAARPTLETLLWYRAEARTDDQKPVGGKMILQGTVQWEIGYLGEGENEPILERLSVPFSQIMDIPEGTGGTAQVVLQPEACHVEPLTGAYGSSSLHVELHMAAQVVFLASREITYLADAYSVRCACTAESASISFSAEEKPLSLRDTARENLKLENSAAEVLYCRVRGGVPSLEGEIVRVPMTVHILYRTEHGALAGMVRRMEAELRAHMPEGSSAFLSDPVLGEPYVSAAGDGLDIRLPVEITCLPITDMELNCISALELEPDTPCFSPDTPSLIVIRWGEESLWTLAKRYGSTTALLKAANPDMASGDLLLIPRAR